MTKIQAQDAGREAGKRFAETFSENMLRASDDLATTHAHVIAEAARDYATRVANCREGSGTYDVLVENYKRAALNMAIARRNELPDIAAANRLNYITRRLTNFVAESQNECNGFAVRFTTNPYEAMRWRSDEAFKSAARLQVFTQALALAQAPEFDADELCKNITARIVSDARSSSRSTSDASNITARQELSAWAEVAELLRVGW
jgi:hypothetical protein